MTTDDAGALTRRAIELIAAGAWELEIPSRKVTWSPTTERIYGVPAGTFGGTLDAFLELIHPDDRELIRKALEDFLRDGGGSEWSIAHRIHRDGEVRWLGGRGQLQRGPDGAPARLSGLVLDLTGARALSQQLDQTRTVLEGIQLAQSRFIAGAADAEVFELLVATMAEASRSELALICEDPSATDEWSSRAGTLEVRAIRGMPLNDPPPRVQDGHALLGELASTRKPVMLHPADGTRIEGLPEGHPPIRSLMVLPVWNDSRITGFIAVGNRDGAYTQEHAELLEPIGAACALIMRAIRQRDSIRTAEARFRALIESSNELVLLLDADGLVRYASPSCERVLGYRDGQLLGNPLPSPHPKDAGAMSALMKRAHEQPRTAIQGPVIRVAHVNGHWIHLEGTVTNLLEEPGVAGMLIRFRDVSDRVAGERERARLQAQVQHSQKLESLAVLAGGIAHDFNNLLVTILGNISLAATEIPATNTIREALADAEGAAQRAADLCRQMLAYSGRGRFVVEPVDVSALIEDMVNLLKVSISKKAVLKLSLSRELPLIEVEPTQLRQVVMNIVINASEAIGDRSGLITITTGAMHCDRSYLSESYLDDDLPEGIYTYIEVADTGVGMDHATQERVFDPFFTTKFTGRGLGLASVLGIVRGHRGAIKIYSELGRGTTFKVLLPELRRSSVEPGQRPRSSSPPEGSGTVLVIDDEDTVRATVARMLERAGYRVLTASHGREALPIYQVHQNEITVVLLDVTMPHMDGPDTFRELKRIRPDVRVVLTSGYNEQEAVSRFAGKGLAGFIQKPFRAKELIAALRTAVAAGS